MKSQQKLHICRFLLITLLTLFALTSHAERLPYQSNPLLATVEGQAITLDDVKTKAIHDLTLQLYQQLQQRLPEVILERLQPHQKRPLSKAGLEPETISGLLVQGYGIGRSVSHRGLLRRNRDRDTTH